MTLKELRELRAKAVAAARVINDLAASESRALSDEESSEYDKRWADVVRLGGEIAREEKLVEEERAIAAQADSAQNNATGGGEDRQEHRDSPRDTAEYRAMFNRFLTHGRSFLEEGEVRALSAGSGVEGGFMITPMVMATELLKNADDLVFIRTEGTVMQMPDAESLGVASLDTDPDDFNWTTEIATGSEDASMAIGRREFAPNPLAKRIKVSETLLRRAPSAESIVLDRLAYKLAITQEKAYLTGTGGKQPLGLFTASTQGISTGRDVATANTTTAITTDGLKNSQYNVKMAYRKNAKWLFHRDTVKQVSLLKDTTNQYLWQPSNQVGQPDRLLGNVVLESEYTPNTFTTGQYVGMFGDFRQYHIVDSLNLMIKRLNELYAETNQIGFIGRYEGDGMPMLEEAFSRITLA